MWNLIKKNFIASLLLLLLLLLFANVLFTYRNQEVLATNYELQKQTDAVKRAFDLIFSSTLRQMDLGLRGYALTKNKGLLNSYNLALEAYEPNMREIDSLLFIQHQDMLRNDFSAFKTMMDGYIVHSNNMKKYVEQDNIQEFLHLLNMDKGKELWDVFLPIFTTMTKYENNLIQKAQADYKQALNANIIFQFALILISLPILAYIVYRLKFEDKSRTKLLSDFRDNNLQYVFNPGKIQGSENPKEIIENSISNLKRASTFIKDVTNGNYETQWSDLTTENVTLNKETIVGNLVKMRDEMKRVKEEDKRRLWITDGLAQFSEVVRNNQHSVNELTEAVVKFLTKYLDAQQGSLFLLTVTEEETEPYLLLSACYAFDKKKFVEKRIEIGSGLVGQVYLEGTTTMLAQLPQGYTNIISGLGHATPTCLAIIPMKYNQKVESVFELAGFNKFEDYQLQFLEKAGEFVASAINTVRTTEKTGLLLKQSQEHAEMLRAQEEEMRQNMEELQATQDEMGRKENEMNRLVKESREHEKELQKRLSEIDLMKEENARQAQKTIEVVEKSKKDLTEILNHIPEKIFLKDNKGNMVVCNKAVAKVYGLPIEKLIGTHDYDHFEPHLAKAYFEKEQEIIKHGAETYIQEENLTGELRLLKTTKMPFFIHHLNETGLLGVQSDITDGVRIEQKEKEFMNQIEHLNKQLAESRNRNGS